MFECVFNFYRTGDLQFPSDLPQEVIMDEVPQITTLDHLPHKPHNKPYKYPLLARNTNFQ